MKKPTRNTSPAEDEVTPANVSATRPVESAAATENREAGQELPPLESVPSPTPRLEYVPFNSRLTIENDLALARANYHLNREDGKKVRILNDALREYLERIPESKMPMPSETRGSR